MDDFIFAFTLCAVMTLVPSCSGHEKQECNRLLAGHNQARSELGLAALSLDPALCDYAQKHADKMAKQGRLVHSSMSTLAVDAGTGDVAENIAWGQNSEEEAVRAWMESPGHRRNITGKRYKRVGFGVREDSRGRKYWCAVFAS